MTLGLPTLVFPRSREQADQRAKTYKSRDPFPSIQPALLNSADIKAYAAATGMLYPFYPDDHHFKPASYEVALLGNYVYWEPDGTKCEGSLERGDTFQLKPNSIAFLTLEPRFRLPDYIAVRFNLKIRDIYRGILVGTGPLVDPGFEGRLSLPLHNLTANEYRYVGGEAIVWMEFTKLSPNERWTAGARDLRAQNDFAYSVFPAHKVGVGGVSGYLHRADQRPIRSSIPEAVAGAQRDAARAAERADEAGLENRRTRRRLESIGVVGLVALALALVSVWGLIKDSGNEATSAATAAQEARNELARSVAAREQLAAQIASLRREIRALQDQR